MEPTLRERAMECLNNHLSLDLPGNPSAEVLIGGAQTCLLEELVELSKEIKDGQVEVKEELQEIKELLQED